MCVCAILCVHMCVLVPTEASDPLKLELQGDYWHIGARNQILNHWAISPDPTGGFFFLGSYNSLNAQK